MITERRTSPGRLWEWLQRHLPVGLEPMQFVVGYGMFCGIYARGSAPGFLKRSFEIMGDPVAVVLVNSVTVYHPQWFSDFKDLLLRYEAEEKPPHETKIVYWEGD